MERHPEFNYARIEQALCGLLPITELNDVEHEEYLDCFSESMQEPPTEAQRAYYAELRKHPSAVGTDEHDNLVFGRKKN